MVWLSGLQGYCINTCSKQPHSQLLWQYRITINAWWKKKQLQCCCVYQSVFGWRFVAVFQLCHSFTLRVMKCRRRADANDTTWHASSENRKLKDWKTKSEQADSLMRRAVSVPDCHYCQNAMQVAWLQTNWPQTAWAVHGWPSLHLISLRHLIYSDTRKKKKNEYMTCES